jgi:hypothetical protein
MQRAAKRARVHDASIVIYAERRPRRHDVGAQSGTRRALEKRFGDKLHVAPRIFIAHATRDTYKRLHGSLASQLLALLTGFDSETLEQLGDLELRDAVTDELV